MRDHDEGERNREEGERQGRVWNFNEKKGARILEDGEQGNEETV